MGMLKLEEPSAPTILKSIEMSALQRIVSPDDVANAVVFVASPASSYITGRVYRVLSNFIASLY